METECLSCRKRPGVYACVECEDAVCKSCSESLTDSNFITLESIPSATAEGHFCGQCFDREMAPKIEAYREVLAKAEEVFIFFKTQRNHVPLIKKSKILLSVLDGRDRDQTILHLAYYAAKDDHNAVVDCEVVGKKVNSGGSNKTGVWTGTGFGAVVDAGKIERQDTRERIYR